MKDELLINQLKGMKMLAEKLDGELLSQVVKHLHFHKDDSIDYQRAFNAVKSVYENRFGTRLHLS